MQRETCMVSISCRISGEREFSSKNSFLIRLSQPESTYWWKSQGVIILTKPGEVI